MPAPSLKSTPPPWPAILATSLLLLAGCAPQPDAEMLTEIPWALISRPLVIDTHSHTRFSDGKYQVDEVVQLAINNGCDALAITDHSDLSEDAATPDYFSAINAARTMHPGFILFGGIEEWLADKTGVTNKAVLIYNHPSRKDDDPDENLQDLLNWRDTNQLFIGFEGAPGHQKTQPTGSYAHHMLTQDRWDPVAAEIGGTWDRLLDEGHNVWAALAVSDFHNDKLDHSPCEFARTHIYPEDRSARGILAGLRAGSFWADHGRIVDDLLFTLTAPGLSLPVTPGEVVRLSASQPLQFMVLLQRGAGALDSRLVVEFIGNGQSGKPELLFTQSLLPDENRVDWTLTEPVPGADGSSVYLRARIRKPVEDGADLMAYTNAIRVVTH